MSPFVVAIGETFLVDIRDLFGFRHYIIFVFSPFYRLIYYTGLLFLERPLLAVSFPSLFSFLIGNSL